MKLTDIDFSKYKQARGSYMKTIDGDACYCFMGVMLMETGLQPEENNFFKRFEDFDGLDEEQLSNLWWDISNWNDMDKLSFEEIREKVLSKLEEMRNASE